MATFSSACPRPPTWRRPRCRAGLALAALGLLSASAQAEPLRPRLDSELGYEPRVFGSPSYATLGLGAALVVPPALEAAAGVRAAFGAIEPSPGASAFVRASLFATEASYRPALGIELEATSATRPAPDGDDPPGALAREYGERNRGNALRAALVIAAARWQWQRLFLAAASARVATPLGADAGRRVSFALTLVTVGWAL
jgi:hypothetical protein